MLTRFVVTIFRRSSEAVNNLLSRFLNLLGPLANLFFKFHRIICQVIMVTFYGERVSHSKREIVRINGLAQKISRTQLKGFPLDFVF